MTIHRTLVCTVALTLIASAIGCTDYGADERVDGVDPSADPGAVAEQGLEKTFAGSVSAGGADWKTHTFDVTTSGTIAVTLDWPKPSADLNVFLYDPSGRLVVFSTSPTARPEKLTTTTATTGTWSVGVKAKTGSASYTLAVSTPGAASPADGGTSTPDGGADASAEPAPVLPAATAACPTFTDGAMTFRPAGTPARTVQIYMDPASTTKGPLVFVWHGQYGAPASMVSYAFGAAGIADIKARGGIVVAPSQVTSGQWDSAMSWSTDNDDARLMDEVVACAANARRIDPKRIHSLGMSLGGFNTAKLGMLRSNYVASVVVMSAGYWSGDVATMDASPSLVQRPSNKYASMIFHGGDGDTFEANTILPTVKAYRAALVRPASIPSGGHFTILCDHGRGHVVPTDASAGTRRFFDDHPYGAASPYASGSLPSAIPSYCVR